MKKIFTFYTLLTWVSISLQAQPCTVPPVHVGKPQMGAMISPQFSNLWKQAKVADKHGELYSKGTASIGDDGWTVDGVNHNFRFMPGEILPHLKKGDIIKVKFKGTMDQVGSVVDACTIQNIVVENLYTAFEVKITNDTNVNGFAFQLKNRCTDIQMMRPGYVFEDTRLLTDEYMTHVAHWSTFRYMNLLSANSNFGETWAKRVSPNAPVYINKDEWSMPDCEKPNPHFLRFSENSTPNFPVNDLSKWAKGNWSPGAPWETLIEISNYANKDMWINIPVMADDNYVLQLSKLIKQKLKPTLNVHVEIGNELWNHRNSFMGYYMTIQVLADEFLTQDPEKLKIIGGALCPGCNLDGYMSKPNPCQFHETTIKRWMARRLKEMMEQFAVDWGWKEQGGVGSRIRATLAGQLNHFGEGNAWNIRAGLEFLTKAYGVDAPSKYLYSVSVGVYFQPTEPMYKVTPKLPVDQIVKNYYTSSFERLFGEYGLEQSFGITEGNQLEGVSAISSMCGVKMFAYAGGNFLGQYIIWNEPLTAYDSIRDVIKNTQLGLENTKLLNEWYARFGDDALFIKDGDYQSDSNVYAISSSLNDSNALRQSYINVATNSAPARINTRWSILGSSDTTILDARKHAGYQDNWDYGYHGFREKTYSFMVNHDYTYQRDETFSSPMLILCERPGVYKLELERSQVCSESITKPSKIEDNKYPTYCDIYLDEKLIKSGIKFPLKTLSRQLTDAAYDPYYWWTESVEIEIPYGTHALRVRPSKPTAARPGNFIFYDSTNSRFTNHIGLMAYRLTISSECQPLNAKEPNRATELVSLYPNPTQDGLVTVQIDKSQSILVAHLLDIHGKKLKNFTQISSEMQIDISELADGCYTLVLQTDKGNVVRKIVKIK